MIVAFSNELWVKGDVMRSCATARVIPYCIIPNIIIIYNWTARIIIYPIVCIACDDVVVNGWGGGITAEDSATIISTISCYIAV